MPTYQYQCFACGHQFEEFQKMSDDPITKCPSCGADEVKRLIAPTAFHLKGSGWYKTDYGSSGSSSEKKNENSNESRASDTPEKKSENKNDSGDAKPSSTSKETKSSESKKE